MKDDEPVSLISTKHGAYVVERKLAVTWRQRYPDSTGGPPKGYEDHKFWPTPQGWVFARPDHSELNAAASADEERGRT